MNKPFIELPTLKGTTFVNPEDIMAIKADDKHISILLEKQQEMHIRLSIASAEKKFDFPYMVRCHRSYIANLLKIKGREKNGLLLKLSEKEKIPVSKSYKKSFEQELEKYCERFGE